MEHTEKKPTALDNAFRQFTAESENFFVTKLLAGPELKKEYKACLDIVFNITGTMDSNRGISAFNRKYGQGKTFFFDVVNHRCRRIEGNYKFKKTTAKELVKIFTSSKKGQDPLARLDEFIRVRNLLIDDVGDEIQEKGKQPIASNYANKLNVVRYVILRRYEHWERERWKTFITTNIDVKEIAFYYDGRVADRLLQMTYWREFSFLEKGSFRQVTESRKLTPEEIQANLVKWNKKYRPQAKEEKIDTVEVLNDLLTDNEYREAKGNDWTYWGWIGRELVTLGQMKDRKANDSERIEATVILTKEYQEEARQKNHNRLQQLRELSKLMDPDHQKKTREVTPEAVERLVFAIRARKTFNQLANKPGFEF